jgi:GNAT superfamily N-acetyltransferase
VSDIEIRLTRYGAPVAQALVAAALADLGERYGGPGDKTPLEAIEFDPPDGAFVVAYVDGTPVGCGGWRSHDDQGQIGEIKRMYTAPEARGLGVARAVLAAVEQSARGYGRRRLILETGDRQPEAIKLYEEAGYEQIENFGFYRTEPGCLSYGRQL